MSKAKIKSKPDTKQVSELETNLDTIIKNMAHLHSATTQGCWMKGNTSHETVCQRQVGQPYKIAEFRHADDASFVDYAHTHMPALIAEIHKLRKEVGSLKNLAPSTNEQYLIVWVKDENLLELAEKHKQTLPEYFCVELENRAGRKGYGRVWASPKFDKGYMITNFDWTRDLDDPMTKMLSVDYGGIVIDACDLVSVLTIPAIITNTKAQVVFDNRLTYKK